MDLYQKNCVDWGSGLKDTGFVTGLNYPSLSYESVKGIHGEVFSDDRLVPI
jgi:hypothetical protein